MKAPSVAPLGRFVAAGRSPWTCSSCRSQLITRPKAPTSVTIRTTPFQSRSYSNGNFRSSRGSAKYGKSRSTLYAAAATGATGAGLLAFTDDIKHSYEATERAGRVASALFICINDYRTSLNKRDKTEDPGAKDSILRRCHKRCAERTLKVLEKNGGIFIKLGQHLSAMTYLLPIEWTDTFIPLQDKCPVSSYESIVQMFREDSGEELSDYFSYFSETPVGAASLAQVHLATIKETGQKVAVKVQHPTLARWAPLDLSLTSFTFSTLKRFFPEYDLEWLSSEMEVSLPQELDFQLEAANAIRTKQHFQQRKDLPLVVPEVIWAKKRILVMANESGHRLDDLAYLDQNGIDRDEVSATLAHIFNEMIFGRNAPLHCDPHGGNIAIRKKDRVGPDGKNFEVILYDHGLYRTIPENLQSSYAKMWLAVIDGNMEDMKHYAHEVAGVTEEQFPLFASAITGRDFTVVKSSILKPRSTEEKKEMGDALQEGLLSDLVQMLGQVPRIILLILKTNDLTRSLDENLHTKQGPVRTFLILARYCAWTVFREQVDELRQRPGSLLSPGNALRLLGAWIGYMRVEVKLGAFELWLTLKRITGLDGGSSFGSGDFRSSVINH
ncbi:ABC1 family-domain-containing protein [Microdochium trichocladiopsis]|uniref:ABC1 family-domain-containing protein n=1 Tax=Microdochium trichocladiopsis TaxID=1682393 RepID=A0A9P9BJP5_9PEZI|nr:ABC1 family-domain-containing protein [Microdochium trichocladiopsis]KAH7025794.1 ABC1 family-domain-containing protein [Microdochium trichocladiopsis]